MYYSVYKNKLEDLIMISDGLKLKALFFKGQKGQEKFKEVLRKDDLTIFKLTIKWLDEYFRGKAPQVDLPFYIEGTNFQKLVYQLLLNIPYGKTITYKDLALKVQKKLNKKAMSAQAIGQAVSKNQICLIIPCHRVVAQNSLGGYAAGISLKKQLLKWENAQLPFKI